MKIFAIGKNYLLHNKEIDGALYKTAEPVVFMKPESALLKNGKPFFLPDHMGRIDHEAEVVVRISRLGKNVEPRFAHRYYDAVTVGIDFTARDLQRRLKDNGHPWEVSKAFDGSAALGEWIPLSELDTTASELGATASENSATASENSATASENSATPDALHFHLDINGQTVQQGFTGDMLFKTDELISYVSRFFTLKTGDMLFTGTPAGVGPVHIGDHLEGYLGHRRVLNFYIR